MGPPYYHCQVAKFSSPLLSCIFPSLVFGSPPLSLADGMARRTRVQGWGRRHHEESLRTNFQLFLLEADARARWPAGNLQTGGGAHLPVSGREGALSVG